MAAKSKEACIEKQKELWAEVVDDDKFVCLKCGATDKGKYKSQPFSHFAVCLLDDGWVTERYYVVSKKDLFEQHRAVEGPTTKTVNPVMFYSWGKKY